MIKNDFEKLWETIEKILIYIDNKIISTKSQLNCLDKNLKTILLNLEKEAIKNVSIEQKLTENTIKERWKILTLPSPIVNKIENGEISYTKFKPLANYNFDFESDKDIEASKNIINFIENNNPNTKDLKSFIQLELNKNGIWNESDIIMRRIAKQHGIKNA